MSQNSSVVADEWGEYDDFIELSNTSNEDISLAGYFVSDSADEPFEAKLPEGVVVPAKGFLLLWADHDPQQGGEHVDFALSAAGDGVWLTSPDGTLLDAVQFGASTEDWSYARYSEIGPDGSVWDWCAIPTPGAENGDACGD